MRRESQAPTPYGVHCTGVMEGHECNGGEIIYLTEEEYNRQLMRANAMWKCPRCNHDAWWDDENYGGAWADE